MKTPMNLRSSSSVCINLKHWFDAHDNKKRLTNLLVQEPLNNGQSLVIPCGKHHVDKLKPFEEDAKFKRSKHLLNSKIYCISIIPKAPNPTG